MRCLLSLLVLLAASECRGAADFASGSSQYGEVLSFTGVSGAPCTLACFFKHEGTPATRALMAVNSSTTQRMQMEIDNASNITARAVDSGGGSGLASAGVNTIKTDVWYHGAAVFTATNDRAIYLNGVRMQTNADPVVTVSIDRALVGTRRASSAYGAFFDGPIAAAAIWNQALSAEEISALGNTNAPISPLKIRPHALVFYAPLHFVSATNAYNAMGATVHFPAGVASVENPKLMLP